MDLAQLAHLEITEGHLKKGNETGYRIQGDHSQERILFPNRHKKTYSWKCSTLLPLSSSKGVYHNGQSKRVEDISKNDPEIICLPHKRPFFWSLHRILLVANKKLTYQSKLKIWKMIRAMETNLVRRRVSVSRRPHCQASLAFCGVMSGLNSLAISFLAALRDSTVTMDSEMPWMACSLFQRKRGK